MVMQSARKSHKVYHYVRHPPYSAILNRVVMLSEHSGRGGVPVSDFAAHAYYAGLQGKD